MSIGGFSVGETKAQTWDTLAHAVEALPPELPRYLMGMGAPEDLWNAVSLGVDMLDCIWPTRTARNAATNRLMERVTARGRVMLTGCEVDGRALARVCVLSFRTRQDTIDTCVAHVAEEASAILREVRP